MIIDLRYHIASLVAVFLALGLGILVGSTILSVDTLEKQQEQIAERLENHLQELREENQAVRAQVLAIEAEMELQKQFLRESLPRLVAGQLEGRRIALVQTAAYPVETELQNLLKAAGAEVVSVTTIPGGLELADHEQHLLALGEWRQVPKNELQSLVADEMARSLVEGLSPVVEYLVNERLVSIDGEYGRPFHAVVLIGGGKDPAGDAVRWLDMTMIERFQSYGLRVCGVETRGAPVSYMKEYQAKLSCTVDNVDAVPGQFTLVRVLAGQDGHYGVKDTAQRFIPPLN
jgi:hypothetical protein